MKRENLFTAEPETIANTPAQTSETETPETETSKPMAVSEKKESSQKQASLASLASWASFEQYYDINRKEYLVRDKRGVWMALNEGQFRRDCKMRGISAKAGDGAMYSQFDAFVTWLQRERGVDFVGQIAGYPAGLHVEGSNHDAKRLLVTRGATIIEPSRGEFATLQMVLENILGNEQSVYFFGWLQHAFNTLRAGGRNPGQALFLIGAAECGKTLIQDLITQILGGREAKPWKYMAGLTNFNGDLIGAEHLRMGDEVPHFGIRERKAFGERIKNICVEPSQSIEAKYCNAIVLNPFWRLTGSLNDEPETLQSLPMLDKHTLDKLILLKCERHEMPMPTATTEQRKAFWKQLCGELPALLHWLTNDFKIPQELVSQRYSIRHYHNPEILDSVQQLEPEEQLLAMIDELIFDDASPQTWTGTAVELDRKLKADGASCRNEARQLLKYRDATARYLGRLAERRNPRVFKDRSSHERSWRIERANQ